MSKVAIVYWSGTGHTKKMAEAVKAGAESKGAEVTLFAPADFDGAKVQLFDAIAFGCPAYGAQMGAEVLEDLEFQPMFDAYWTILCETVCVNSIIKSGLPILSRIPFLNLQKTFALHPCLVQRSQYCRSIHSFPPMITTFIFSLLSVSRVLSQLTALSRKSPHFCGLST